MTEKGKGLIRQFEGCKLVAYKCPAGKWTIGYGSTFYADGTPVKEGDKIDQATANQLFDLIVADFEKQVKMILGDTLVATLPKEAVDALISIAYNIGTGNFSKSTLLKRIKADKNNLGGIEDGFLMWVKAGGKVLNGLQRRRAAEFAMYRDAILSQYTKWECYQLGYKEKKEGK